MLAAAVCAGGLLWSEIRERRLDRSPPPATLAERLQSIEALVRTGSDAIPELLTRLSSSDPKTRGDAVLGLGRIGSASDEVREAIQRRLSDEEARVRLYAFSACKLVSRDQGELDAAAARMLSDSDNGVRDSARRHFEEAGLRAVPAVIEVLKSESPAARSHAIGILKTIHRPEHSEIVAAVRDLLADSDPGVRVAAIRAVAEWGAARPEEARAWLRDNDPEVAFCGLRATDWSLADAAEEVPHLVRLLLAAKFDQMRSLAAVLRALKTAARPAIPRLLQLLQSPDEMQRLQGGPGGAFVQAELLETLAEIGGDPDDLARLLSLQMSGFGDSRRAHWFLARYCPAEAVRQVSLLIPQLESKDFSVSESALRSLSGFGGQASAAVPALIRLVGHSDHRISQLAAMMVVEVEPTAGAPAVPLLLSQLERARLDPSEPFHPVIVMLGKIGPTARDAIPGLLKILESPQMDPAEMHARLGYNWLRLNVILALGRIGCDNRELVAVLCSLLKGDSWQDRAAAAEALSSPGISTPAVLEELVDALRDENAYVRANAALAIGELPGERRQAVGQLIAGLKDDDPFVRTAVAIALGQIGTDAAPAVEPLRDALDDPANAVANYRRPASPAPWNLRDDRLHDRRSIAQAVRSALVQIESGDPAR